MTLQLRRYQASAREKRAALLLRGRKRSLYCGPTGMGKTVLAAADIIEAAAAGMRVLMVAHRRELIRQPFAKLIRYGVDPQLVGVIMAGVPLPRGAELPGPLPTTDREIWKRFASRRPSAPVQIASIDTLRFRHLPTFDVVIIDEAHRTMAKGYRKLLAALRAANPNLIVIGLTATPQRADGQGLDAEFDDLILVATYRELVDIGFLVEPRAWTVPVLPDVSRVKVVGGDYDQEELQAACNQDGLVGDIVKHYVSRGNGAPALVFAAGVEHSKRIVEKFLAAGIPAAHVDATTDTDLRDEIFEQLGDGRLRVVSNCDIAGEGTDIPCVKCVILARPTKSLRVHLQQCGRGSRPHGDLPFVVLDHAGNLVMHGMPQDDREWSLEGRKKRPGGGSPLAWTCRECLAVNPLTTRVCLTPQCEGVRPVPERKELKERDGELVEVRPLSEDEKRAAWDAICDEWRAANARRASPYKPGWVLFRFKEKFKCPPPPGCALPSWSEDEVARRNRAEAVRREGEERGYDRRWAEIRLASATPEPAPPAATGTDDLGGFLPPVTTRWA